MANPWDEVKDAAVATVKDALRGFVDGNAQVDDFVKDRAEQYAKEWWGSVHAATEAERAEHATNLEHIKAQVKGEFARLQVAIAADARNTVVRVLEAVGGALIRIAPKILAAI
jgi:hypothetical protein